MRDYKTIADAIANDIASGRIRPGERLPPQRTFAYQRGIAVSTASRVYDELRRRGLTTGEVGRGTYVRIGAPPVAAWAPDPMPDTVDLELNFGLMPEQLDEMRACLESLLRPDALAHALRPVPVAGNQGLRELAARFLSRGGWTPSADDILFAGNGRQALAAAISGIASPGDRIGVEALTFPLMKGVASRLGITLVPIAVDDDGLRPDALLQAHRSAPLKGVFLRPELQNPLGINMSGGRRNELAATLHDLDLYAIEDGAYSFLMDEPPLVALAPDHVLHVATISKIVPLGVIVSPTSIAEHVATAIRTGAWGGTGLGFAIAVHFMRDAAASRISAARRQSAQRRQEIAREVFRGMTLRADPRAFHVWLELPPHWRADDFVAAAARCGIAITAASAFAVGGRPAPNAVRIALEGPPIDVLPRALETLRRLAERERDEGLAETA